MNQREVKERMDSCIALLKELLSPNDMITSVCTYRVRNSQTRHYEFMISHDGKVHSITGPICRALDYKYGPQGLVCRNGCEFEVVHNLARLLFEDGNLLSLYRI